MTGILKVQLHNLERSAETLERIVYNDLTALESLPDSRVEQYEPKVWKKLEKLDELQDEIEAVIAKLKALGEYSPIRTPLGKATLPTAAAPKPKITRRGPAKDHAKVAERWNMAVQFMENGNGVITQKDLARLVGVSQNMISRHFIEWTDAGMLKRTKGPTPEKHYERTDA